ncbi:hypothetical protein CAPTEDRAFT_187968 [Capitella teleta]|uniref:15-oxoprostaglandin 13-reductase n=1 Tax=Capitella teleta TaxID=283909 RepID=R7U461_CAPTE|nr:hypothetical protein CAPTEDRAFT_187968 [Capitella teleta]|eukprot:ELU01140.1 hypothetical protein CAPTEDRAFT_187968 [Capitella teleta]
MADNFRVVLQSRPGATGVTCDDHFRCESCDYPTRDLAAGEVLLRAEYLSIDPALRCTLNEDTGVDYVQSQRLNETIVGFSGIGRVVKSAHAAFKEGDAIFAGIGFWWQKFFIVDMNAKLEAGWINVDPTIYGPNPVVHVMSLTAATSLIGLWEKGNIKKDGEQTLVVSGAAGACGSLAGQMGSLLGCKRVVGICGSDEKCRWLTEELGFNGAINYKSDDISAKLKELCPQGVQVYFDNVGGHVSDCVIAEMTTDSHIILCGQISAYNEDLPYPPPIPDSTQSILTQRNITRDRFTIVNYPHRILEAVQQFGVWVSEGRVKVRASISEGLETAGPSFVSMMNGGNIGKQLVHI